MAQLRCAGPFANDGERRLVDALRRRLPPNAIIITNLFLPVDRDTLEIDAVVVASFGVIAVEVKSWHGRVHFEAGRKCKHNDEVRSDPRESISLKAKKLHGRLGSLSIQKHIVTNPVLLFANDTVHLSGNLEESVRTFRLSEGVQKLAEGRIGKFRSPTTLSDREIQIVADSLCADHDSTHLRKVGQYLLGDQLDSPVDEWWAFEGEPSGFRVRLRRYGLDPLATGHERREQLNLARRNLVALRQLEQLRLRSLPLVYTAFLDPNDDTVLWTATEAIEGRTLLACEWTQKEKLAALAQTAETLAACHGEGVLHRALTSDCIIIPMRQRTVRILHFDLARVSGRETVAKGAGAILLRGVFSVAPEIRNSAHQAEPASDVYSLGIVAAEALLQARFTSDRSMREAIRKIKPKRLSLLLLRCLEAQPALRPSMSDLAELLRKESQCTR